MMSNAGKNEITFTRNMNNITVFEHVFAWPMIKMG